MARPGYDEVFQGAVSPQRLTAAVLSGKNADGTDFLPGSATYVWDPNTLSWVPWNGTVTGGGGGGGAVTIADGADVAQGSTTDADTASTVVGLLKKIKTLLSAALTVSVNNFPGSQAVTGTFWQATQPVSIASMPATPATDNGGSLTVDAPVGTPVFVRLSDGSSAIATLPVSLASLPTLPAGTNNIGDVDVLTLPALPAGTNNIGDVDVLTLPAIPAGNNNIGDVDIASFPAITKGTQGTTGVSTQNLKDSGRTHINLFATGAAAGATGVETAITLTKSSGTSATSPGTSFAITNGKKFRITSITFATRGHATATAQETTFKLRINTGGAVSTTSTPIVLQARSATPATASAWDRISIPIPDGFEIDGTATLQIGVTAAAVFTTNAPTWDVLITGFEY